MRFTSSIKQLILIYISTLFLHSCQSNNVSDSKNARSFNSIYPDFFNKEMDSLLIIDVNNDTVYRAELNIQIKKCFTSAKVKMVKFLPKSDMVFTNKGHRIDALGFYEPNLIKYRGSTFILNCNNFHQKSSK